MVEAGASFGLPLEDDLGLRFVINGRSLDGAFHGMGGWRMVSPGYFDVFRIPLLRGRGFSERDRTGAPGVVIISETMAKQFWPDSDPLLDRKSSPWPVVSLGAEAREQDYAVPAVSRAPGRVTAPGVASAASVAVSRYMWGSTPTSFADSHSV